MEVRVSAIFKALQRLEEEEGADAGRSLDEQGGARRPPPDHERRGLKFGAVAIGGLAVAAAVLSVYVTVPAPVPLTMHAILSQSGCPVPISDCAKLRSPRSAVAVMAFPSSSLNSKAESIM